MAVVDGEIQRTQPGRPGEDLVRAFPEPASFWFSPQFPQYDGILVQQLSRPDVLRTEGRIRGLYGLAEKQFRPAWLPCPVMCPTQVSQNSNRARVSAAVGQLHDCQRFRKESDGFRRLTQSNVQNSTVIQRKSRLRVLRAEYLATEFKSPPTRRPGRLIVLAGIGNDEQVLVGPDELHIWMVGGAVSRG